MPTSDLPAGAHVIEELTLTMDPSVIGAYLERDAAVWTPFLADQPGFLGKEVWLPTDRPDTVVLIIRWATRELWNAITDEQCAAIDAQMGELVADRFECREYVTMPG